jgi:hypothetical protein
MRGADHSFREFVPSMYVQMYVISEPQQCGGLRPSLVFVSQKKEGRQLRCNVRLRRLHITIFHWKFCVVVIIVVVAILLLLLIYMLLSIM